MFLKSLFCDMNMGFFVRAWRNLSTINGLIRNPVIYFPKLKRVYVSLFVGRGVVCRGEC